MAVRNIVLCLGCALLLMALPALGQGIPTGTLSGKVSSDSQPLPGVTHEELVNRIRARGHRDARVLEKPEDLAAIIASRVEDGDYVVCLGAGNITQWAAALPGELGKLMGKEAK